MITMVKVLKKDKEYCDHCLIPATVKVTIQHPLANRPPVILLCDSCKEVLKAVVSRNPEAKLTVYLCNYDGNTNRLVAAKSMREAAKLSKIPYHHFRVYGHETGNAEDCAVANSKPGTVFSTKIGGKDWKEL